MTRSVFCIITFAMLGVFSVVGLSTTSAMADDGRHVLLISIDGFPAYLFDDPRASIPVLRQLAADGVLGRNGMQVSNPSITWPNHTSLVTGAHPERHGMVLNAKVVRHGRGELTTLQRRRDKDELVAVPTIYDVVHDAGLTTGVANWPATRNAPTVDYNFPGGPDRYEQVQPRQLEHELHALGILDQQQWRGSGTSPVIRDELYTRAAEHIIQTYKPRLMMVHLLNMDSTHHKHGPRTPASYEAAAYADACVSRLVRALEDAGIREQTAIIIGSDHGFVTTEKEVHPNVVLRQAGLLDVEGDRAVGGRAHARAGGGRGWIYLLNPDTREQDRDHVMQLFANEPGIADAVEPQQYAEYGLPNPDQNPQMGDLWIIAEKGYAFSSQPHGHERVVATEPRGYHGYPAEQEEMRALFLASGPGIRRGHEVDGVNIIDIAPTIAALLKVAMPSADGRVLEEIFE